MFFESLNYISILACSTKYGNEGNRAWRVISNQGYKSNSLYIKQNRELRNPNSRSRELWVLLNITKKQIKAKTKQAALNTTGESKGYQGQKTSKFTQNQKLDTNNRQCKSKEIKGGEETHNGTKTKVQWKFAKIIRKSILPTLKRNCLKFFSLLGLNESWG